MMKEERSLNKWNEFKTLTRVKKYLSVNSGKNVYSEKIRVLDGILTHDPESTLNIMLLLFLC